MTSKELVKRVEKIFSVANSFQIQALSVSKKRFHQALKGEIAARNLANKLFDQGLAALGKGIVLGRKAKESFSASTNRKSSRLQRFVDSETALTSKPAAGVTESKPSHAEVKRKKSVKSFNRKTNSLKKVSPRARNPRTDTGAVARSH